MSNYIINGRECAFPRIPFSTLQQYGPCAQTYLTAWRMDDAPIVNLYIRIHLTMLEHIGCVERLFHSEADGYGFALYDVKSDTGTSRLLTDLDNYLRILCGTRYLTVNPYIAATHRDEDTLIMGLYTLNDEIIARYRARPSAEKRAVVNDTIKLTDDIANTLLDGRTTASGQP